MDTRGRVAVGVVLSLVVLAAGGAALFSIVDEPSGGADASAVAPVPATTIDSTTTTTADATTTTTPTANRTTPSTTTTTSVRAANDHGASADGDGDTSSDNGTGDKTCTTSIPNDTAPAASNSNETVGENATLGTNATVNGTDATSSNRPPANGADGDTTANATATGDTNATTTADGNGTVTVSLGKWADVETQNTTVGVQVTRYRAVDVIPSDLLRADYRGSGLNAPDGKRWVVANVRVRNIGPSSATVSPNQWSMTALSETGVEPSEEATQKVRGVLETNEIAPYTGYRYRVIFAMRYTSDAEFTVEPRAGTAGRTVRIVSD